MEERKIIKIVDSGEARYCLDANFEVLGRMWDNEAEEVVVVKPERERDHACIMIVTVDGKPIEHIDVGDEPVKITNLLSRNTSVDIGFTFVGVGGYTKNTEVEKFYFLKAQKPDDFVPVEPENKGNLDLLIAKGFVDAGWKEGTDDTIQYLNSKGEVVKEIQIKPGIDNTIDNLVNYYLKSETYSREEVNNLIKSINSFKKEIVETLPTENIDGNTIYLVAKTSGSGNDYYDEYLYINGAFELIGSTQIDLTDYVKNTDYASPTKGGVVKVNANTGHGIGIMEDGRLRTVSASSAQILAKESHYMPIVPSTIDYAVKVGLTTNTETFTDEEKASARTLIGAVGSTDYATGSKAGLIKATSNHGFYIGPEGDLSAVQAQQNDIDGKNNQFRPITSNNLDYAVKSGLTTNTIELTEEEQAKALNWLGAMNKDSITLTKKDNGAYTLTVVKG